MPFEPASKRSTRGALKFHPLSIESLSAVAVIYNRCVLTRWSIAVRTLLSVCLVLNGLGAGGNAHARHSYAQEAIRSQAAGLERSDPGTATTSETASRSPAPCHGADKAQTQAAGEPRSQPAAYDSDDSLPGCCHLAGCRGTCLQHPPGAIVSLASEALVPRVTEAAAPRTPHASPEPQRLTRPPIA